MSDVCQERNRTYVEVVLAPGFDFASRRLARYLLEVNVAHLLALKAGGHLPAEEADALLQAAGSMLAQRNVPSEYDPRFEDLFFMLEDAVAQRVGAELAGSMHLAMSRNDLDTAIFRMAARERLCELADLLARLRRALLAVATREAETVMPAYTHNQQAQPTTLGHYLAAVEAALARDAARLDGVWSRTNLSPLGAAALAGTGFTTDRHFVAGLLGFEGLVENTYDAVASADYLAELAGWCATLATDLSRFSTDLLYWCTSEVAALKLAPEFLQISSIMPQKRNPVALEHLRAVLGKALGETQQAYLLMHNVPFGDVNDVGEQLQPVIHSQCDRVAKALELLAEVIATVGVDRAVLEKRAADGFSTSTELADTLVRADGLRFRVAHRIVSKLVDRLHAEGRLWRDLTLEELNVAMSEVIARESRLSQAELAQALDPREFVRRRANVGCPAPAALLPYLADRQRLLEAEVLRWEARGKLLGDYRERLVQSLGLNE